MLKIAGMVLVIVGCTGMGFAYKQQMEERLWHLRQMRQVLVLISASVRYGKATLPESCRQAAEKLEEPYRNSLMEVHRLMKENKGLPFSFVWKQEMTKMLVPAPIGTKEKELFLKFGAGNGYMDNRLQQQAISQQMEELELYTKELEKNIREKSKVAVCLGIMGGMFLTIVLI